MKAMILMFLVYRQSIRLCLWIVPISKQINSRNQNISHMTKKLSFDALPAAVEKILEILTAEGSEHTALPELVQRMTLLEKKMDYLQKTVSPDRPVMDTQTVCRVLKLRPKAVSELATSGVLPSRTEGRRTLFYEDAVVKYFMTQPAWKEATASKPAPARRSASESAPAETNPGKAAPITREDMERQLVDINRASEILGRSPAAIRFPKPSCPRSIPSAVSPASL